MERTSTIEKIRAELWAKVYVQGVRDASYHQQDPVERAADAVRDFDKVFKKPILSIDGGKLEMIKNHILHDIEDHGGVVPDEVIGYLKDLVNIYFKDDKK